MQREKRKISLKPLKRIRTKQSHKTIWKTSFFLSSHFVRDGKSLLPILYNIFTASSTSSLEREITTQSVRCCNLSPRCKNATKQEIFVLEIEREEEEEEEES